MLWRRACHAHEPRQGDSLCRGWKPPRLGKCRGGADRPHAYSTVQYEMTSSPSSAIRIVEDALDEKTGVPMGSLLAPMRLASLGTPRQATAPIDSPISARTGPFWSSPGMGSMRMYVLPPKYTTSPASRPASLVASVAESAVPDAEPVMSAAGVERAEPPSASDAPGIGMSHPTIAIEAARAMRPMSAGYSRNSKCLFARFRMRGLSSTCLWVRTAPRVVGPAVR